LIGAAVPSAADPRVPQPCTVRIVSRQEIAGAMRRIRGYDIAATTNAPRLGADVFIDLATAAIGAGGTEDLLLVRQVDWFPAFLEVTGLTAEQAPPGARLAYEHRQDMLIDYHRDRVLAGVEEGPAPDIALAVRIEWPPAPGAPGEYSYEDTLSIPKVRVTSQRVVEYRLLEFGDMIVYDRMEGLSGRPTSGLLGIIFAILGDASVVESRIAVSANGFQVVRARAKKVFTKTSIATFDPNGIGVEGIPPGRPDLRVLEAALEMPLRMRYRPFPCLVH
ncbi:MAG: hypothetical protein ACRELX_01655, partial [Longimicrobiales bacterium]